MRALIVGNDGYHVRNIVGAARALGLAGWQVGIGSPVPGLAARSRWTIRWHRIPSPAKDIDRFAAAIDRAAVRYGYEVVFPGGDAEVLALSAVRDRIRCQIPLPPLDVAERALDKLAVAPYAAAVGLAMPKTRPVTSEALAEVDWPVMVKARLHWRPGARQAPDRLNVLRAHDRQAVEQRAREIDAAGGEAILQDIVNGRHTAYVALLDENHDVVAAHQQDGYGTWPEVDGVWTRAETVPLDPDLHERCAALLRDLRWVGLMQVQFLVTDDGARELIDLNGRFYASIGLAVRAGVNLPALWGSLAIGAKPATVGKARPGVRYQWLEGDLLRAVKERRGGLAADVLDCLRFGRGAVPSLWRSDDPMPGVAWMAQELPRAIGKLRRVAQRPRETRA